MRRPAMYSRSPRTPIESDDGAPGQAVTDPVAPQPAAARERWQPGRRSFALLSLALCAALAAGGAAWWQRGGARQLTQRRTREAAGFPGMCRA